MSYRKGQEPGVDWPLSYVRLLKRQYIKTGNRLLETGYRYRYRCDIIIRGRPPSML